MNEKQSEMWDLLAGLEAEVVLGLLTDYHGLEILDDGFYQHLIDEGYIDDPEDEQDEAVLERQRKEAIASMDFMGFCETYDKCCKCPVYRLSGTCEDRFDELYGTEDDDDE